MSIPLRQYWDLLSRYIQPQKGRFILLVVLMLGSTVLQVLNPQIMRYFIDTAMNGGAVQVLTLAALAFIGIALVQQVVSIGVTYLGENVAWTATNALRAELAWHCLNLDMGFHNEHTPGELIERIDGDVAELANFFSQMMVTIFSNGLLLVGILVALFLEDWRAGLAFSLFAAASLYALNRVRDIAMNEQKIRRQSEADLFGFVEEQLNATEDLRSSGAEEYTFRELFRLQGKILRISRKTEFKGWIIGNVTGGMLAIGNLLAFVSGYLLYSSGAITIGTVYMFIYYINLLEAPIWTLTHQVQNFQTIGACIERLTELRKLQPLVKEKAAEQAMPFPGQHLEVGKQMGVIVQPQPLELTFEGVSFSYNSADTILRELTFHLRPGRVLGLLGRTGSGKTTLTRLIFRLYDPTTGRILVDGTDLREGQFEALRRRIGVVTQEVQLFKASVRDNLTLFDRSIPDERIISVLEELELGDWFHSLPEGLDTILDTGGHSLSAGESQLLAFARI
ncbi:MAG: ABC transporter ATP-binding protein, partial [Chloroflexi bacterium]